MQAPHITLEQWRALMAVVDHGGYAQAAAALNKSQSAVTYAVQKIEEMLGLQAFEIVGRKAVLTPTGHLLYRRARALIEDAGSLERAAKTLSAGWEAEIHLAVEILFPTWLLFDCLAQFGEESPNTRIEVIESVISGTSEALIQRRADIAIAPIIPQGFVGERLMILKTILVTSPDHPLQKLGRPVTLRDLAQHRHLVVRDSGTVRDSRAAFEVAQRWTVSHMASSVEAAIKGHGFAGVPQDRVVAELADGRLKKLHMQDGGERLIPLYLIIADADLAGPGVRRLAEIIRAGVQHQCEKRETELGA
jgi:DNA-binding transcriptional LysR family regulator